MTLWLGYGITGIYALLFGSLARFLLKAPRTIGLDSRLYDFFLVVAATILATFLIKLLIERWKQYLGCRPGRPVSARARSTIRSRLLRVVITSLILGIAIIVAERSSAADRYTPYHPVLFAVSLAGALLVESLKKLVEFRPS